MLTQYIIKICSEPHYSCMRIQSSQQDVRYDTLLFYKNQKTVQLTIHIIHTHTPTYKGSVEWAIGYSSISWLASQHTHNFSLPATITYVNTVYNQNMQWTPLFMYENSIQPARRSIRYWFNNWPNFSHRETQSMFQIIHIWLFRADTPICHSYCSLKTVSFLLTQWQMENPFFFSTAVAMISWKFFEVLHSRISFLFTTNI